MQVKRGVGRVNQQLTADPEEQVAQFGPSAEAPRVVPPRQTALSTGPYNGANETQPETEETGDIGPPRR